VLVQIEDGVDEKVARENTELDGNIGFEKKVDGQPDCEVLGVERALRRDPEHIRGRAGCLRYKFR
jgi:hypothetical protein